MPRPQSTSAAAKTILVMVGTEYTHSRDILAGLADYEEHHRGRWFYLFEPKTRPEPILRAGVDGMIVEIMDEATGRALLGATTPRVQVTGEPQDERLPVVTHDNLAVGRMAAAHLADLGLKHLGFVPSPTGESFSRLRAEGFAAACTARKLRCHLMPESSWQKGLQAGIGDWLTRLPKPVGIAVANDRLSFAVSRECRRLGLAIPEQVALLGVDNEAELCKLAAPPLSSIDHGSRRLGYEAARLLDEWLTGGVRPRLSTRIPPVGVIARQSTDLLAVEDSEVAAALRFIRTHAAQGIRVPDVLRHVTVSRSTLEPRFAAALGRSIFDEITRVRMERGKDLLIQSDWRMANIAEACGYGYASEFTRAFRRVFGVSPIAFRRQFRYERRQF